MWQSVAMKPAVSSQLCSFANCSASPQCQVSGSYITLFITLTSSMILEMNWQQRFVPIFMSLHPLYQSKYSTLTSFLRFSKWHTWLLREIPVRTKVLWFVYITVMSYYSTQMPVCFIELEVGEADLCVFLNVPFLSVCLCVLVMSRRP